MVREAAGVVEEEEELQEAIRRSLLDRSLGERLPPPAFLARAPSRLSLRLLSRCQ